MLRRLKADVDLKIPPKKEILVYAPLSQLQQNFYQATVDKSILNVIEEKNVSNKSSIGFTAVTLYNPNVCYLPYITILM